MLEHVYKFEKNIIRVGGRSESTIMQQLNITSMRKNANNFRRNSDDYQALDTMKRSLLGLKAAFAQRGVVIDDMDYPTFIFPNDVLARLYVLLKALGK
jgi:hypothetical protein